MKTKIENFIRDNKKDFDQFDAPIDLWEKIEKKLDQEKIGHNSVVKTQNIFRRAFFLKIAAAIIPLTIAAFIFYQYQIKQLSEISNIDPAMAKQQMHYTSLIEVKRSELKRIEKEEPKLYQEFISEIKKIDENYLKLKNELPVSPNQEETLKAMIRNLEIQIDLLNQQLQIIRQINQLKKEQSNEQNI